MADASNDEALSLKRKRTEVESQSESQTPHCSPIESPTPQSNPQVATPTSSNAQSNLPLPLTGKEKSNVWEHFTKILIGSIMKAECKYCKKLLGGSANDGTRHLRNHIDKSCPKRKRDRDIRQMMLAGSQSTIDGDQVLGYNQFDQAEGRKYLAEMIILHEYPLSMVDHFGFRRFLNRIQPVFKVVTRNTIKKDILKIYDIEKEKQMKILEKNRGKIAITCDMWTADNQNKGYMAITAHFIDQNWKLNSRVIRIYSLEKCDDEIRRIKRICSTLFDEYKERDAQRQSRQASDVFVNPNSINMNQADATTTKAHMAQFDMFMATRASTTHGRTELDIYLEEVVLPRSEDFDVLGWWKSNGTKYPILQNIAKDILAIPVSTVASESAFSTGGRVVSKHRSRLLPNTLEALMCAQNWLWNDIRGDTTKELQTMEDDIDEDDTASVITT